MKILLLGGTGAMGEHLTSILNKRNHDIYITTRSDRKSDLSNQHYIQGNAHDFAFLKSIINSSCQYDAIVDFMHYSTIEFSERYQYLLNHTKHYLFLSSARVYAEADEDLTEESPRLLDICKDEEYLSTDDYALAKARQEDLLINSGRKNYTIIRPFITFSEQRLQLGVFEKEDWLFRVFENKPIVFSNDIANHITTLTYGFDVSTAIAGLIGNEKAKGEILHITTNENVRWSDIVHLYKRVLEDYFKRNVKIIFEDKCFLLDGYTTQWAVKYSRYFNYRFNNSKMKSLVPDICFEETIDGLEKCLREFLDNPKFKTISPYIQARMDRVSATMLPLSTWKNEMDKLRYLFYRFAPICLIKKRLNNSK